MRTLRIYWLLSLAVIFLTQCRKEKTSDPVPPPPVPEKNYKVIAIRDSIDADEQVIRFEYGANGKPTHFRVYRNGLLTADSTFYFYNAQKQLFKSVEYTAVLGTTPREIRLYYYNEAGMLIGDTAYHASMIKSNYWDHKYTYDAEGRLLKFETSTSYYRRYEYGAGKNPVRNYMKPYDRPVEALFEEYTNYDDKKAHYAFDPVMKIILMNISDFQDTWPICSFINNSTRFFRNPYPPPPGWTTELRKEITQNIAYNDGGYPTRIVITTSKSFEGGDATVDVKKFEYERVD